MDAARSNVNAAVDYRDRRDVYPKHLHGASYMDDLSDPDTDPEGYYDYVAAAGPVEAGDEGSEQEGDVDIDKGLLESEDTRVEVEKPAKGPKPLSETMKMWIASQESHEKLVTDLTSPKFPPKLEDRDVGDPSPPTQ
ncbi:hypothetical protein MBLNU230_g4400t1 [Neophaeotheca triangularis]